MADLDLTFGSTSWVELGQVLKRLCSMQTSKAKIMLLLTCKHLYKPELGRLTWVTIDHKIMR